MRSRSPTAEDEAIADLVREKLALLEKSGWKFLAGATRHYQGNGLTYLQEDVEKKKADIEIADLAARTCAHCRTVRDNSGEVRPCPRCEDPICVNDASSCRQNNG